MPANRQSKSISDTIAKVLKPLIRILIRNGISYGIFAELAKWTFVDVAYRDFQLKGRKQSFSRVSVITGLSRKAVKQAIQIQKPENQIRAERYNVVARIISAWQQESEFLDEKGKPAALLMTGNSTTFKDLCKRYSSDISAITILDEMLRVGAVKQLGKDRVALIDPNCILDSIDRDSTDSLGIDVSLLIKTIDHNLKCELSERYFMKKIYSNILSEDPLPTFRNVSSLKANAFIDGLNHWLANQNLKTSIKRLIRNFAGIGIYYFEEPGIVKKNN